MQTQDLVEYLEQDVKNFNQLFTFIPYQPSFYNYITKYQLKSIQIELKSEEFIPSIFVNDKLQHKIKYHQQFKQAYGLANSFEFDNTISIDIISYDIEETYKEKLENDNLYPILLNFAVTNQNWNVDSLVSFINQKACSYNTINIDLLYLNLFRFILYFQKCNQITTFLHYPSIKFRLQEIRHTNKFVETPLTKMITKSRSSQKKEKVQYKFGFLSLDQSNRIFPLMIQDPLIFQLPLIGTWLYSNDPYDEPLNNRQYIWTMLTEFICSPHITRRICKDQYDQFLFIQFQKNQSPQFFEVSIQEDPQYKIVRSQEKIINLDNHQIDLASAQPFSQIEQVQDLYNPINNINKVSIPTQILNKQKIQNVEPVQTIEQSFQQESTVKQLPVPQPLDSNQSYQSANFPQNQHLTERLVIMQSEQLKLMQTQIIDLQRALLQQMQKPQMQQPMSPPRNEQTFHPSNKRMGLPVQKIDFLSEQLKLKTQSKKKEQEIEELAQQILCDKIESMQNSTRNSINKLISQNNSNNSENSNQHRISTNKKQSLGDLIISMKDSDIKRQIKRNQAMIQDLNGNAIHENHQYHSQSLSPFSLQNNQSEKNQFLQIQSPTFYQQKDVSQFNYMNNNTFQQESPTKYVRIDQFTQQLQQQQQYQQQQQQQQQQQYQQQKQQYQQQQLQQQYQYQQQEQQQQLQNQQQQQQQLQQQQIQQQQQQQQQSLLLQQSQLFQYSQQQSQTQQQSQKKLQQQLQSSNNKQSVLISSIQKSYNKENVMSNNQLEQSAGSKAMPKIKFNLKDYDDSDSDEEVKKLQMKYLKKR